MDRVKHKTCKLGREGIVASPLQHPVKKLGYSNSASHSILPPLKAKYTRLVQHLQPRQPLRFGAKRFSGASLEGQPASLDASPVIGGASPNFCSATAQYRSNWSQLRLQRPPMRPSRHQYPHSSSFMVLPK